ncbi:tyrosine phosphatase family-domain-containing protein [Xylariales sp. AK1849]|nr:tyrosine phosphatase family-domain-containing protein [Xylariales sp. AK1849]
MMTGNGTALTESIPLREEAEHGSQSMDTETTHKSTGITLVSLPISNRHMESSPEVVLQEVYHSARDVARTERPLLISMVQPQNFGFVIPGVYRSSYPQSQDYPYLRGLKLKTIITLVQRELPEGFQTFMDENGIRHQVFGMTGTKKEEIPLAMMRSIIGLVIDKRNHPILIHCKQGRHRTGCVVGVLRKFHGWDTHSVLAEYEKYAHPKVRETDVKYLSDFKMANLRHVVARKLEDQPLTISQFLFLVIVAAISLCVWSLTLYRVVSLPSPPPRRQKT